MKYIALLTVLLSRLHAQEATIPAGTRVFYTIKGEFDARAPWDVNLVNAPITAYAARPSNVTIEKNTLKALNKKKTDAFRKAAKSLGIKASASSSDFRNWRGTASATPPYTFLCDIQIAGDNGLGGNYGGLEIRMTLKSLFPDHDLTYGFALETVTIPDSPGDAEKILQSVYERLIVRGYVEWQRAWTADQKRPNCTLNISFDLLGLEEKQRRFLHFKLLDCIYALGKANRFVSNTKDVNTFAITYQLKRYDENETEADYLLGYAHAMELSLGTRGKYDCSLAGTPLESWKPLVTTDIESKTIRLSWTKP
jgi:hypothetical protein